MPDHIKSDIFFFSTGHYANFHVSVDSMSIVTLKQELGNYGPKDKSSPWPIFSISQEVTMCFTFLNGKEKKKSDIS